MTSFGYWEILVNAYEWAGFWSEVLGTVIAQVELIKEVEEGLEPY